MQVRLSYDIDQLNDAVKYISINNKSFRGKDSEIKENLLKDIKKMAKAALPDNNTYYLGTMGYIIIIDSVELESIENDHNTVFVEILVDPTLGNRNRQFLHQIEVVDIEPDTK